MLERFYAICNCCACCCGAMKAHRNNTPMLASSGYVAQVDHDQCVGCGDCNSFCQFRALSIHAGVNQVDLEKCMGCGICISKCPEHAISLQRDESKGIPLEIHALMKQAAQEKLS
jgi:ferredoxin